MALQAALSGGSGPPAGLPGGATQVSIRHSSAAVTSGAAFEVYAVYQSSHPPAKAMSWYGTFRPMGPRFDCLRNVEQQVRCQHRPSFRKLVGGLKVASSGPVFRLGNDQGRAAVRISSLCGFLAIWGAGCSSSTAGGGVGDAALPACEVASDAGSIPYQNGPTCFPEAAKPSGSCSVDTAACFFCSDIRCSDGTGASEAFYNCRCASGSWICDLTSQGASACPPGDGGLD
jgi:hypothetical protein